MVGYQAVGLWAIGCLQNSSFGAIHPFDRPPLRPSDRPPNTRPPVRLIAYGPTAVFPLEKPASAGLAVLLPPIILARMEPRVHFEVIHITARAALLLFLAYSAGATLVTTPPPLSCRPLHRRTAPSLYRLTAFSYGNPRFRCRARHHLE
jgi:hypothetical protein